MNFLKKLIADKKLLTSYPASHPKVQINWVIKAASHPKVQINYLIKAITVA